MLSGTGYTRHSDAIIALQGSDLLFDLRKRSAIDECK